MNMINSNYFSNEVNTQKHYKPESVVKIDLFKFSNM